MGRPDNSFFKSQSLGWILMIVGHIFLEKGFAVTSLTIFLIGTYFFCKSSFSKEIPQEETPTTLTSQNSSED